MSELVIRAPLVRLLVPHKKAAATVQPVSTTEVAPVSAGAGPARRWELPEHDDDLDARTAMARVSGWFLTPQG